MDIEFWDKPHPRIEEAMAVEYDVFRQWGYIEPNAARKVLNYDIYPDFRFLVGHENGNIIGVARNIFDRDTASDHLNFPTANDFDLWPQSVDKILAVGKEKFCETGTMAVIPDYQGHNYSVAMINALIEEYNPQGIFYTICALDKRFFDFLMALHMPFEKIGDPKFYMGSLTVPAIFDSTALEPAFFKKLSGE